MFLRACLLGGLIAMVAPASPGAVADPASAQRVPGEPRDRLELLSRAEYLLDTARFAEAAAARESYASRYPDEPGLADVLLAAATLRAGLEQEEQAAALLDRLEVLLAKGDPKRAAAIFWARRDLLPRTYASDRARERHAETYVKTYASAGDDARLLLAYGTLGELAWRRACRRKDQPLGLCVTITYPPPPPPPKPGERPQSCAAPTDPRITVHPRDRRLVEQAQGYFREVFQIRRALRDLGPALERDVREAHALAELLFWDLSLEAYLGRKLSERVDLSIDEWRRTSPKGSDRALYRAQVRRAQDSNSRFLAAVARMFDEEKRVRGAYSDIKAQKAGPRATLAATARLAIIQAAMAAALRRAPLPRGLESAEAVRAHCELIEGFAWPFAEEATAVLAYCESWASWYDDASVRFCADALGRLLPHEYPPLRELLAAGQALDPEPEAIGLQEEPYGFDDGPDGQ